jgi:hypothetical protein
LDSNLSSAVAAAAEHLAAHGWAVVPGVLSRQECQQYEQGVWDWLGRLSSSIRCAAEHAYCLQLHVRPGKVYNQPVQSNDSCSLPQAAAG